MNNSSSELNFRTTINNMNKINNSNTNTASATTNIINSNNTASINQKKLDKHSVSMYHIQQIVEIKSDEQEFNNTDNLNRKEPLSASTTRRTFIRNTAGSFDLNVNSLNLNESQSNLRIIIEAQQNDRHSFPIHEINNQHNQQHQQEMVRTPIDSVFSGSASALASSFATSAANLSNSSNENRRYTSYSTTEFLTRNEEIKRIYNEKNRSEPAAAVSTNPVVFTNDLGEERELSSTGSFSDSNANYDSEKIVMNSNNKNRIALPISNEFSLNNNNNFDTLDSIDLINEDSGYANNKEANNFSDDITNKNMKLKKQKKTSAFAWVGRTVGKRINKHHLVHNHHHHTRRHLSPNTNNTTNMNVTNYSIINNLTPNPESVTAASATSSKPTINKKYIKIDWTEHAKQGVHMWSDINNTQSVDSCYLNEPDALEFHKLKPSVKCLSSSKGEIKKKCLICKIVVHETCIEKLQQNVKCRPTYREALTKKKSFRDKEFSISNQSTVSNSLNQNLHHWICRKYDENKFENKCRACLKSYTNRFGLQTSRTIVSCSWCKTAYHLKCFSQNLLKIECNFGDLNQLIVPPSWIVKSAIKNSVRLNHLIKPYHRTSKRVHHQMIENSPNRSMTCDSAISSYLTTENHNMLTVSNNQSNNVSNIASHQISFRAASKPFIIRPPLSNTSPNLSLAKPLLVLINPKSGGKLGPKLLKKFNWHLNPRQVFDLTVSGCPKFPLHLFRNVPNLRLLVGGGDGTVGWVLSIIDQINFLFTPPSIAVLPLGTGNDLARALNWGSVYTDEPLSKILTKVAQSKTVKLDRWKITTELNSEVDLSSLTNSENAIEKLKNDVMNNYFSLGADAHICLEFHERREANPQKFTSRWFNLLHYLESGSKDLIKKTWKDLKDFIQLECDNKSYTELIQAKGYHFIIFLNISKYSGGTNPWGSSTNDSNFQPQSMNDGQIEVIGCYTSTLPKIQIGGTGERICQAKYIKLITSTYIPIQIDGEPAKLAPSIIEIKHKNQAFMLEYVKYNTESPIFDYNSSIHKNFQVKCIMQNDYERLRKLKDPDLLINRAIHIGTIYTSNLDESLSQVRNTINNLINDTTTGFFTAKWSFLNGDEFYRIGDDSDEVLSDIVSSKEIVFILNEDDSIKNKSDFLFTNPKILDSLDSTPSVKTNETKNFDPEEYDLDENYESGNQSENEDRELSSSKQHLNIGPRIEKIRSSQSSPKIFDNQTLVHVQTITSSKSTQFISLSANTEDFL